VILLLQRDGLSPYTTGTLSINGERECHTLELPWRNNRRGVSCIPAGVYRLAWVESPSFKRHTLRLEDVPDRDGILIHPANEIKELRGCIAFGLRSSINPEYLGESRRAVKKVEAQAVAALERGEIVVIDVRNP
jgi:hypothetical protein